jgi:integrase
VWRTAGRRYFMNLGYPDEPMYQRVAVMKGQEIERDILYGRFDSSLEKYQDKSVTSEAAVGLVDLWRAYTDYKRPQLKQSTIATTYKRVEASLAKLPTTDPSAAVSIRDWAIANLPMNSAKRFLVQINACCKWAVRSGLLQQNGFLGMAQEIRVPKAESEEEDIDPFTAEERDQIIEVFQSSQWFAHYAPLVQFLFFTGCRPSEALALQWKHVGRGCATIRFEQALTQTENGLGIVAGLKTQERRSFPCNERLQQVLQEHRQRAIETLKDGRKDIRELLVFPAPKGKFIHWQNFGKRGWAKMQTACGLEPRNPYQMRHTFITLALATGLSPQDIGKLVGNSAEVIYRHYAGVTRDLRVPDF